MDGGDISNDNASPMADEQPHPEPVLAEEAESSTEPSQYGGDTQEFYRVLRHLLRRFSASARFPVPRHGHGAYTPVMVGIVRDGILTWYVDGEPVEDGAYRNGGVGGVPTSDEAIAALLETTVGEGETRGKECAVCLEAYEAGDTLRTMPCSHDFHEHCIFQWLRASRLCPLCWFALPAAVETESFVGEEDDDDGGDGEEEPSECSDS